MISVLNCSVVLMLSVIIVSCFRESPIVFPPARPKHVTSSPALDNAKSIL